MVPALVTVPDATDIPICTPITTEQEIAAMGPENAVGHYTSFNYFQSVDTPQNKSFVERYKAKYGKNAVTNAVMEAAYFQTYFLAQAKGCRARNFRRHRARSRSTRRTITHGFGRG